MVLIVDDNRRDLDTLEDILKDEFEIVKKKGGYQAIDFLYNSPNSPSAILLNTNMHGMDGFQVMDFIQHSRKLRKTPVIVTAEDSTELEALFSGAADFIQKPYHPLSIKLRVKNQVMIKEYTDLLERDLDGQIKKANHIRDQMLCSIAEIIEYRNLESGQHVKRTATLYRALVHRMVEEQMYEDEINDINNEELFRLVPLHDIGKIGIPDNILLKPSGLNRDEFEVVKKHTTIGKEMIGTTFNDIGSQDSHFGYCTDIVYSHHEKYDGSGYPESYAGQDIPLCARIMTVVDVYDALVNPRVYKEAVPHGQAMELIKEGAGTHFDPLVTLAAVQSSQKFENIEGLRT
jgi:putative two-component system response regulator